MGYYMAGGYYRAGGFSLKKLGRWVGKTAAKVAPAVSILAPGIGSMVGLAGKLAGGGGMPATVPPAPAFPGMGYDYGRRPRRSRRRRRRSY